MLREQTELFGPVASRPTAWRALDSITSLEQRTIPVAVAAARARVWAAANVAASRAFRAPGAPRGRAQIGTRLALESGEALAEAIGN